MGKYNKYYEEYYNKNNIKEITKEDDLKSAPQAIQSRYVIRNVENKSKSSTVSGMKKLPQSGSSDIVTIISVTTIIPIIFFITIYLCQYTEKTKIIYEYVKETLMTENLYENNLVEIGKKFGIKIVDEQKESNETNEAIVNNDKALKFQEEKIKSTFSSLIGEHIKKYENEENFLNEKIEQFRELVENLNGTIIKAKSETGIVLECKYKILANPIEGVVSEVGENAEGDFLIIKHENGIETIYYNLPKIDFKKGQNLKSGEKISDIKEEREIVFKMKENNEFISPKIYSELIK